MRRSATVLIAIIAAVLFVYSPLFASDFDPIKTLSSSYSQLKTGLNNGIQRISTSLSSVASAPRNLLSPTNAIGSVVYRALDSKAYSSWTAQNRAAMPKLAAQWDHYTSNFGAAGAPLFVIGQVTNPMMSYVTGVQPGSQGAKDFGRGCNDFWGGIINVPTKVLLGRDLANPEAPALQGWNRLTAVTANETLQYSLFVGMPAIAKGAHVLSYSDKIPWLIRPGTYGTLVSWPTIGFAARSLSGPLFGETVGSRDNIANSGLFAAQVLGFSMFNVVSRWFYPVEFYRDTKGLEFFYDKIPQGKFLSPFTEVFIAPIAGTMGGLSAWVASGYVNVFYKDSEMWRNYVNPVTGEMDRNAYIDDTNKRDIKSLGNSLGWQAATSIARMMVSQ